jgi:spore germination protein GerM
MGIGTRLRSRAGWITAAGLLLLLLISLVLYWARPIQSVQRVLFFPTEVSPELVGEIRAIANRREREDDIIAVIKELILGPMELWNRRALPREARLRSVLLRNGVAYVDLSEHVLFSSDFRPALDEMIEALRKTVLYNFRRVRRVVVFVEGQLPRSEMLSAGGVSADGE